MGTYTALEGVKTRQCTTRVVATIVQDPILPRDPCKPFISWSKSSHRYSLEWGIADSHFSICLIRVRPPGIVFATRSTFSWTERHRRHESTGSGKNTQASAYGCLGYNREWHFLKPTRPRDTFSAYMFGEMVGGSWFTHLLRICPRRWFFSQIVNIEGVDTCVESIPRAAGCKQGGWRALRNMITRVWPATKGDLFAARAL